MMRPEHKSVLGNKCAGVKGSCDDVHLDVQCTWDRFLTALSRIPLSIFIWIGLLAGTPLGAQEIWLAPQPTAVDRLDMFKPDAPWSAAASHTQVFKFYANQAFNAATQSEIDPILADINRRGIAIALESGFINVGANPRPACGGWGRVEGYGPVAMHETVASKIKKAGGIVKYIAMDEPLWYGHYFKGYPGGQPGCHSSVDEILKLIMPSLDVYIREFPGVQIGDIEPSNALANQPDWQSTLTTWTDHFRATTGRPLAFLQLDITWDRPQAPEHGRMVYTYAQNLVHQKLLGKIGIIYDGNPQDPSDAAWVEAARDHIILMERDYGLKPDQAIIQSWHTHPTHAMPDTSPDTLTGLVDFYVSRERSSTTGAGKQQRQ